MAITGTGTQADPFLVHSYEEIKSIYADATLTSSTLYYVKLANDINCNNYGVDFAWESITGSNWIDFDLDGHTIKNVLIANGNYLFNLSVTSGSDPIVSKIHNGKILNVFGNSGGIFKNASGGRLPPVSLENLSISINGTSCTDNIFLNVYIDSCAIYFESSKLQKTFYSVYITAHNTVIKNSDIKLVISDLNGRPLFENTNGNSNNYQIGIADCRFTGEVGGLPYQYSLLWSVPQRCLFNSAKIKVEKSCISIDSTNCPLTGAASANNGVLVYISANIANLNNVVNKSITNSTYAGTNDFDCTDEEIRNGDALRGKGFTVVNVVGD